MFGDTTMTVKNNPNYIMHQTFEELKARLEHLEKVQLPWVSQEKSEAYNLGGIHENAAWEIAENEEKLIVAEINRVRARIIEPVIIDDLDIDASQVSIGTLVEVLDVEMDEINRFVIVGRDEGKRIDEQTEFVSIVSPLVQSMLGRKKGEVFDLSLPNGSKVRYKILNIAKYF